MKKSLVALAVFGSVAGAAQAQSSLQLYGVVDLWVGSINTDLGGKSVTKLDAGGVSANRIGFKGTEDLGGGLKANFLLEQGFSADTGVGAGGFDRQSWVGVSGGFGEVQLGNTYAAYDDISGAAFTSFDSALSAEAFVFNSTGYTARPKNNFKYISPSFGGFSGAISYSLDENGAVKQNVTSMQANYASGPLFVGVAHQIDFEGGAFDPRFTRINASYDLGVATVLASYGLVSQTAMLAPKTTEKTNEFSIGANVPMGALTLSGGVAYSKDNAVKGGEKRTGVSLAGSYALSKRTSVYGGLNVAEGKTAGVKTSEASLYAVGVRHAF
ncbi:porin [Hydrogenophaga sp.]|uniref:porin n=1 Tax=Hydrogenophaga sp. TaxID=1904254 RepID=UPI003F6D8931